MTNIKHGNGSLSATKRLANSRMQNKSDHTIRFRQDVPTRTEELNHIREVVEAEALRFGFDEQTAFQLALAVDEACTNIIKHSYGGDPSQSFQFEISTSDDSFVISLTDRGKTFNPKGLPQLDMQRYFEQMRRGGLGVHIMHLVMDDVDYTTATNHSNLLRMIKHLQEE